MRKLLISFVFTLLTAQTAYANAEQTRTEHSVKLIKTFEADKVDSVINSSVSAIKCGEGVNHVTEVNTSGDVVDRGPGRAPAIIAGKSKLESFKELVEKGEFREKFYNEGDIYSYSSEVMKPVSGVPFEMHVRSFEHVFNRKSKTKDQPFEHEMGLTEAEVKGALLAIMAKADESYQTKEKAFVFRIDEKAYLIDLELPLIANPVYKQDVTTGNIDYGFSNVVPRTSEFDLNFVTMK